MRSVPRWFLKELSWIDPKYYVEYDQEADVFEIKVDLGIVYPGEKTVTYETLTKAVFRELNDAAILELRQRKYQWQEICRTDPKAYRQIMKNEDQRAKQKKHELAIDMISRGLMKIGDNFRKTTFS